jgi:hypothetical protein
VAYVWKVRTASGAVAVQIARKDWAVGWLRRVGGGVLWWAAAIGQIGLSWRKGELGNGRGDRCVQGDVGGGQLQCGECRFR